MRCSPTPDPNNSCLAWAHRPWFAALVCFSSLPCLLVWAEEWLWCLVQQVGSTKKQTADPQVPTVSHRVGRPTTGPPVYVLHYQRTLAELREGRVVASYVVPCVRQFDTDELNVIWPELVDELGTSPYQLGLEILSIEALPR